MDNNNWKTRYLNMKKQYVDLKSDTYNCLSGGTLVFTVSSPDFENGDILDKKHAYTDCGGQNILPTLKWTNYPSDTTSFALIIDDPDAPKQTWNHLMVWNIPAIKHTLTDSDLGKGELVVGKNSWGKHEYGGPCPPQGTLHRYFFKLYALKSKAALDRNSSKEELMKFINMNKLAETSIMGRYKKI